MVYNKSLLEMSVTGGVCPFISSRLLKFLDYFMLKSRSGGQKPEEVTDAALPWAGLVRA